MINTPKDFRNANAIAKTMDRMAEGTPQRLASGEMPGHELCTCGEVIRSAWMIYHLTESPFHINHA